MQSITITLADQQYPIGELTLGQLEDIHAEMGQIGADGKNMWGFYRRVIWIGLSVDHSQVTEESLNKMRLGTLQAVKAAADSIIDFGGFRPKVENVSAGEAPARAV